MQPQTAPVEASNFFFGDAAESKEGEEEGGVLSSGRNGTVKQARR